MHWQIATAQRDMNITSEDVAFMINACQREGASTQVLKKVTCKVCKPLIAQPRTPEQAAAVLYQRALDATDAEHWVNLRCNECERCENVDSQMFTYEPRYVTVRSLCNLLQHVAYDHAFGTEVLMSVHHTPFSVYESNLAVGKIAQTAHEERWRRRVDNLEAIREGA